MAKLPAMQFYPGDWMKDPALRSVSIAARGLWIDMLCLMHECDRRGYLQHVTGKPVTAEQLARMTGCSTDELSQLLQELEDSGVFSRTEHGVLYSRRLVRDERLRSKRRASGRLGGNPVLLNQTDKQNASKTQAKPQAKRKQKPTPSSSSSSSSSSSDKKKTPPPPLPSALDSREFRSAWDDWVGHRKEIRKPLTPTCIKQQLAKMADWGQERSIVAMRHTMAMGWQGLREPEIATQATRGSPEPDYDAILDEQVGKLKEAEANGRQ